MKSSDNIPRAESTDGRKADVLAIIRQLVDVNADSFCETVLAQRLSEWMPKMAEEPRNAEQMVGVDRLPQGESTSRGNGTPTRPTVESGLTVRCPACHEAISAPWAEDWKQAICPCCGNQFNLVSDEPSWSGLKPGCTVGHFVLEELLGQGGFGTVWRALDPELDRQVAVKTPRRGDLTVAEGELFLREARAAAQVRHPNVVTIHEVGRDGDRIYLVSDLIDGETFADRLEKSPPSIRRGITWCETLARALHAVHEHGVVHRDLKPGNVLLDREDTPYLSDFGLARRETNELTMTSDGQMIGTPAYLSPEQARGDSHNADRRSDIFSFGTIIYRLLTGELPFRGVHHVLLQQIIKQEPVRPRRLNPLVPRDLETICLKCLEKDPAGRFATAEELADELQRFLHGQPIRSRPLGQTQRALRWAVRHPLHVAIAVLLAFFAFFAISSPMVAVREKQLRTDSDAARQDTVEHAKLAAANERQARRHAYAADMNNVQRALDDGDALLAKQLLEQHLPAQGQEDVRGFEWRYLWKRCHDGLVNTVTLDRSVDKIAVSDDGRFAAVGHNAFEESSLQIVDLSNGETVAEYPRDQEISGIVFDAEGRFYVADRGGTLTWWEKKGPTHRVDAHSDAWTIVRSPTEAKIITAGDEATIKVWSLTPEQPLRTLSLPDKFRCRAMAISPDGDRLVVCGVSTRHHTHTDIFMVDANTGAILWKREFPAGWKDKSVAFSPDGSMIGTMGRDAGGAPRIWGAADGKPGSALEEVGVPCSSWVGFSPSGEYLAAFARLTGNIFLWDMRTNKRLDTVLPHEGVTCATWVDDATLLTGGTDGCLRRWTVGAAARPRTSLEGVAAMQIWHASSSRDGQMLATLSDQHVVQLWDLQQRTLCYTFPGKYTDPPFVSDAGTVYAKNLERTVLYRHQIDKPHGEVIYDPGNPIWQPVRHAVSPDGRWLAVGEGLHQELLEDEIGFMLCDLRAGERFRLLTSPYWGLKLAFSKDCTKLFTIDSSRTFRAWDIASRRILTEIPSVYDSYISSMKVHPTETMVAVGDRSGALVLFDMQTGKRLHSFFSYGNGIRQIEFSRDGRKVIAAFGNYKSERGARGEIRFWDLETGQSIVRLGRKLGPCVGVALTQDELRLTTTHFDGKIFVWDGATDEEIKQQQTRDDRLSSE